MIRFSNFKRMAACGLTLLAIGGGGIAAPTPATAQDAMLRIAAVVNDDIVSVFDLTARLRIALFTSRLPDTAENRQRLGPQVLRALVDERLEMQEAKRLDIVISDKDMDDAIARVEKGNNLHPGDLRRLADELHVPFDAMTDQIRAQLSWLKVVNRLYARPSAVSKEDVEDRLEQLRANVGRPQYHVAEIFIPMDASPSETEVKAFTDKLVGQLRQGVPFSALARQFSRSATAARGGDLGWVHEGQLEREVDAVLTRMPEGATSTSIRTPNGYYIVFLEKKQVVQPPSASETRIGLSQIKLPISGPKSLSIADRDRVMAYIAKGVRGCPAFDAYGKTLGTEGTGPLGSLKVADMPPAIAQVVENLKIGEPSALTDISGTPTVLMVCERKEPDVLPSESAVRETLLTERLERSAARHLADLRRQAIIDLRI